MVPISYRFHFDATLRLANPNSFANGRALSHGRALLGIDQSPKDVRTDAGVVERGGLENRCASNGTQGSNPCLSATFHYIAPLLIGRLILCCARAVNLVKSEHD